MSDTSGVILFSGIGGSTLGIHQAGIVDTISIEWDKAIAAAANENGIRTLCEDIRTLDPLAVVREGLAAKRRYLLLQASPPCTSFSAAGKQDGKHDLYALQDLLEQVGKIGQSSAADPDVREYFRTTVEEECKADTSALTFEPILWIAALRPDFISFEQVKEVLPIWEAYAEVLEEWGYHTWVGNVSSETYGVPQTRKRAFLLASLHGPVDQPPMTHSRYYPRSPERLDEGVAKWISMAEALTGQSVSQGRGMTARPSFTVTGGGVATGGAEPFARGARAGMAKAMERGEWAA